MVEQLDYIYEECINTSLKKIEQLNRLNRYYLQNQIRYGDNEIKTLGEVCNIDKNIKKHNTSYGKTSGKYKFHTGGKRTDLYTDNYDIDELYIIQNRTNGSGKCNLYLDKYFSLAKQTIVYKADNEITTKYIYYYLMNNIHKIEKGFIGANHKNISKEYLSKIKIPIPSLERQKKIVDYFENNEDTINKLHKEIEGNKVLALNIINSIHKSEDNTTDEEDNTTDEEDNTSDEK